MEDLKVKDGSIVASALNVPIKLVIQTFVILCA